MAQDHGQTQAREGEEMSESTTKRRGTGCPLTLLLLLVAIAGLGMLITGNLSLPGVNSTRQATQEDFDSIVNMRTPDGNPAILWVESEGDSFSVSTKTTVLGYTAYEVQARNVTIYRPIAIIIPDAAAQPLINAGALCVLVDKSSYMCSNTTFSGPALLFTSGTERIMRIPLSQ